jgi:hypothetical protein
VSHASQEKIRCEDDDDEGNLRMAKCRRHERECR